MSNNHRVSKHINKVVHDFIVVNESTKKAIAFNSNDKSKNGSKFNKRNEDLRLGFDERVKIYRKAKRKGYYSLNSFCRMFRFVNSMSYHFVAGQINNNRLLEAMLIKEGCLVSLKGDKNDGNVKRQVPFNMTKKLNAILFYTLTSDYQKKKLLNKKDTLMANFSNHL